MKNIELFNDHFQNYKKYLNCKAQLIIADVPYNIGVNAYVSNPAWYKGGGIIKMAKASLQVRSFLILTKIFDLPNLCTFVAKCS
jgi:site-specific DNA-methyltransferase (adenine-specific)